MFNHHSFKQVPSEYVDGKILFCSQDGTFVNKHGRALKYTFSPYNRTPGRGCHNGKRGCTYPHMCYYSHQFCHSLIAYTWIGPRPLGMQIDHLNGDVMDWSVWNLEYVTPKENARRSQVLRALRAGGYEPKNMPYDELKRIFEVTRLIREMRHGIARFTYIKKDGTVREAKGTLNPSLIPADKMPKSALCPTVFHITATCAYFDLERNDWRSFRIVDKERDKRKSRQKEN